MNRDIGTLKILVAGSVDDGKSTLIGRLLYDTHLVYLDQLEAVKKDSKIYNSTCKEIDLSLLTDGLKAEREQGITIDVAYRYFCTEKKSFVIVDAPGHEQYTRNMATGASGCDVALVLVDASKGVRDQTRRHSLIASLMGIKSLVVVINKMDLFNYSEEVFEKIKGDFLMFSNKLEIESLHFVPVSALEGDNVVFESSNMQWYKSGPLLNFLENIPSSSFLNLTDFRLPIQYVAKLPNGKRGYSGTIASGIVRCGDEVIILPSKIRCTIDQIINGDKYVNEAFATQAVMFTTTSEVDISRGMVIAKPNNIPIVDAGAECMVVWMSENHVVVGNEYLLKTNTQSVPVKIGNIRYKYNVNELNRSQTEYLNINDIGRVELIFGRSLIFEPFQKNRLLGSFVLIDRNSNSTSGGGVILNRTVANDTDKNIFFQKGYLRKEDHEQLLSNKALTIWMTGLSGSGKSTIASNLEKILLKEKIHTFVLDGDNLRFGLNSDLGFSPEDRKENIRRAAEVCKLFNASGITVIASFISPYAKDRENAASIIGEDFVEVFIDAPISVCRERDPKGLYAKFDAGLLKGLTGLDAPYEVPTSPNVTIETSTVSAMDAAKVIFDYLSEDKKLFEV